MSEHIHGQHCAECKQILTAAHAQGRAEGLEEAAKIADVTENCCEHPATNHHFVADAIREKAAEA